MASINYLQQVITYNDADIPGFLNQNCLVSEVCNHHFDNFEKITANLGSSVNIQQRYNMVPVAGLVISQQGVYQNYQQLTINQSANVSYPVTAEEDLFTLSKDNFYQKIGKDLVSSLGTNVELNLAAHITSSAIPITGKNPDGSPIFGSPLSNSGPYRFFDYISAGITSYLDLENIRAGFISLGAPMTGHKVVLPTKAYPAIIGSGLTQFVADRNEQIAKSWLVGDFGTPATKYYRSNQLPTHVSGYAGINSTTCTVVSVNDTTGENVTSMVLSYSGTAAISGFLKDGDLGYFLTASGLRALDYTGQIITSELVQFRVVGDADSSGNAVTVTLVAPSHTANQGLSWKPSFPRRNVNAAIVAGAQVKFLPSHKAGLLVCGDAFYAAMPRLPNQTPYPTSVVQDKDTKVALRAYYGCLFGQDNMSFVHDYIMGAFLTPRYCARICLPLTV